MAGEINSLSFVCFPSVHQLLSLFISHAHFSIWIHYLLSYIFVITSFSVSLLISFSSLSYLFPIYLPSLSWIFSVFLQFIFIPRVLSFLHFHSVLFFSSSACNSITLISLLANLSFLLLKILSSPLLFLQLCILKISLCFLIRKTFENLSKEFCHMRDRQKERKRK